MSDTPRTDEAIMFPGGGIAMVRPEFARQLEREVSGKQAVIDRLMMEHCPDEMTPEQIDEWKRHQVAAGPEATAKLDAATERLRTRSAGMASVPLLTPGDTPCKVAAWEAFYATAKGDIPHNADGSHSGTFWVAVMSAMNAYIDAARSLGEVASGARNDRPALPVARSARTSTSGALGEFVRTMAREYGPEAGEAAAATGMAILEEAAELCEGAGGDAGRVVGPKLAARIRAMGTTDSRDHR